VFYQYGKDRAFPPELFQAQFGFSLVIQSFESLSRLHLTPIFAATLTRGLAVLLVWKITLVKLAKCPAVFRIARFSRYETI